MGNKGYPETDFSMSQIANFFGEIAFFLAYGIFNIDSSDKRITLLGNSSH